MVGRAYSVFDTALGRCGIAWGEGGIVGVQLAGMREIETRGQLLRRFADARETKPTHDIELAIDAIVTLLRGQACELPDVELDMRGVPAFNRRLYEILRGVPRGETITFGEIGIRLGASGATHSVSQAVTRNPFPVLVPCHRAVESRGDTAGAPGFGGSITRYRLLSLEGALAGRGPSLFDVLLPFALPRSPS
jgi:methylated-DNA-[protein]-cysteine S-methyltransferase